MELEFTLEKSHLLEAVKLRAPKVQDKKLGRIGTYFSNLKYNIGVLALIYVVLLATFWAVKFIWGYQADGFSLFVGFVVGAALALLLVLQRVLVARNARDKQFASTQSQHYFLKVTTDFVLVGRKGFEQVLALGAIGAITQHETILVIWHPYGQMIIPRAAFAGTDLENQFLSLVRRGAGATLN
jgi:hypothetical protein